MSDGERDARVRALSPDGVAAVHEASMRLLEDVGVRLRHPRARELVAAHGGTVAADGVATLPRAVVREAVAEAPDAFTLHARTPSRSVRVGGDGPPVRAPGHGPSSVRTLADGRRPATLADYETLLKLAQTEDVVTCAGYSLCDPTDADPETKHLRLLERSLRLTDKPVMGSTRDAASAAAAIEMAGIATGDPDPSKPVVAGLVNTRPPRGFRADLLGALFEYATRGQPVVVSSFTMPGASGPSSLAGSLAQANAETLVGVALAQFANPGAPVVYGLPLSPVDGRHGALSVGGPESALLAAAAAQLGAHYDLPTRAGGGLTDAKTVGHQSGAESALAQAATEWSGVDFALHAVGVLESYATVSPEKFVLDCEVLRAFDRFRDGIDASDVPVERIASVEPGGHFVERTPDAPDSGDVGPRPFDRRAHGQWADAGAPTAVERARAAVEHRLAAYERPRMDASRARRLRGYVAERTDGSRPLGS